MTRCAGRLLIVDDEDDLLFGMRGFFERHAYEVESAASCADARAAVHRSRPDVAIIDYSLPDGDGVSLLRDLRGEDPSLAVVILTGRGSIDLAVRAIKQGAEQFLTKPAELPALLVLVQRLVETGRANRVGEARQTREDRTAPDPFLGDSPAVRRLQEAARRVAGSSAPALIEGETGTGKGVLAAWLHRAGSRADEAFVDLNCAGFSRELVESELFGHERGAFTGAVASKPGMLELAHRGTLFLDEIGDMSLEIQPRFLKVLEEKRFRRLGDLRERQVDVRLVAATHRDLAELVADGRFRSDLLYRIDALHLTVPPLRDRGADVILLAQALLQRICGDIGRGAPELTPDAKDALLRHSWPGNVRELRNLLERVILFCPGETVDRRSVESALPSTHSHSEGNHWAQLSLREGERRHISAVLRARGGDATETARVLGLSRSALYQKLKKHGLKPRVG